jgi:hypothetical protein
LPELLVLLRKQELALDDEPTLVGRFLRHAGKATVERNTKGPGRMGAPGLTSAGPWRLGLRRCDPTLGGADLDGYPEGVEGRRPSLTSIVFCASPR